MLNRIMERIFAKPKPPPFSPPRGLCRDKGAPQPPDGSPLAEFFEAHDPYAWCIDPKPQHGLPGRAFLYAKGVGLGDGVFNVTEAEALWLGEFSDWQRDYLRRWVEYDKSRGKYPW